jgi:hypothetical protein
MVARGIPARSRGRAANQRGSGELPHQVGALGEIKEQIEPARGTYLR